MGDLRPNLVSKEQKEQTVEGEKRRGEEEEEEKEEEKKRSQAKRYGTMTMSMDSSKIWYGSLVLYGYYLASIRVGKTLNGTR